MRDWDGVLRYWKNRHRKKRGSWEAVGRGSTGRLAFWKVRLVDDLVEDAGAVKVLELGCGDGRVSERFTVREYLGLDPAPHAVEEAAARFKGRPRWEAQVLDPHAEVLEGTACVAVSLDVAFHLVDDALYLNHLRHLFTAARKAVGIYSTDVDGPVQGHVRHRAVSAHVEDLFPSWEPWKQLPPPWPNMTHPEDGSDCWWLTWRPRK